MAVPCKARLVPRFILDDDLSQDGQAMQLMGYRKRVDFSFLSVVCNGLAWWQSEAAGIWDADEASAD